MSKEHINFVERIEIIESAYEYMLAYAAQGRDTDEKSSSGPPIRNILADLSSALAGLGDSIVEVEPRKQVREFSASLDADTTHAKRAVDLVVSCPRISSQLVDNLNATIHLRSVLTGLFLIDEALK